MILSTNVRTQSVRMGKGNGTNSLEFSIQMTDDLMTFSYQDLLTIA